MKGRNHTLTVTATDRTGRVLDSITVTRGSRSLADQDRNKIYELFNGRFTDFYIFVDRIVESQLPLTQPVGTVAFRDQDQMAA